MCPWPPGAPKTDDQAKTDGSNPKVPAPEVSLMHQEPSSRYVPGRKRQGGEGAHHCPVASQTSKLATISVEQHLGQATPAATARSRAAEKGATAAGDVVPPVGTRQLRAQANKVAVAQASTAPKCHQ